MSLSRTLCRWMLAATLLPAQHALAQFAPPVPPPLVQADTGGANALEAIQVVRQDGALEARLTLRNPLQRLPGSFSVATPPRLVFDLPDVVNGSGRISQAVNEGGISNASIVQVGNRTRVVFNMTKAMQHEARLQDRNVFVRFTPVTVAEQAVTAPVIRYAEDRRVPEAAASVRDVNFRRGKDGEARIVVQLSDPGIGVDVKPQGKNIVVDFRRTSLPDALRRKLDVTDFGTPVTSVATFMQGDTTRLVVTPNGQFEHNAYQSDNQFVIEVRKVVDDPNKLVQGSRPGYQGEKLSLNFQDVDVRAVLQVIADFTNFNIITSDSVTGNVTLRLKDVPWDQALDIILQSKALDKRKNGNVIWIAPKAEIAAKEKADLEARNQMNELEPLRTESFQINYHKARAVAEFLKSKDQSVLSARGSVVVDERTNKVFVNDTASRLDVLRKIIGEIDVAVRQVLIEARIVEAADTFSRNLGVRLGGGTSFSGQSVGTTADGRNIPKYSMGGGLNSTAYNAGISSTAPSLADGLNVNLPAGTVAGRQAGALSFVLWNSKATRFLDLEISALEADGKGKVVSSPRVMTADQVEALIEQGVEIPYQQATSSGATSVTFRKANLALRVRPQITPDGKIAMSLDVNKDTPNTTISSSSGIAIDTKHVKTEVLVENGGTVVIGGIFQQETRHNQGKVPLLGDVPVLGFLFRDSQKVENKTELMVFITPRIITEQSAGR